MDSSFRGYESPSDSVRYGAKNQREVGLSRTSSLDKTLMVELVDRKNEVLKLKAVIKQQTATII